MQNQILNFVILLSISFNISIFSQTNNQSELKGNIEISAFPVHKASLLGLTSTEFPTVGIGFNAAYKKWSFYGTTFHETAPDYVVLSQFESNFTYTIVDGERFRLNIFNTAISASRNNAIYMIPTLSIALGKLKDFRVDATPYTWGFNTAVEGYTYSLLYDNFFLKNKKLQYGFQSKLVYTNLKSIYKGVIAEFSPFLTFKGYRFQTRMIYQLSTDNFIYDIGIKKQFSL